MTRAEVTPRTDVRVQPARAVVTGVAGFIGSHLVDRPFAEGLDGTWNVASGRRTSIAQLAAIIEAAVARPLVRAPGPRRPGDVTASAPSSARLQSLGWRPAVRLSAGVAELLDSPQHVARPRS